jgi:threonine dehydrogenase-like Zn-dependent dehydrogenase
VALDLVNRCHICPACLSGNSNMCENRFKKGQRVLGGCPIYPGPAGPGLCGFAGASPGTGRL